MFKIGFAYGEGRPAAGNDESRVCAARTPKSSLVSVHFPARNMTLSYYNDMFDLRRGDIVYVDGKLEGLRGRVIDVSYSFKIKLSDYKRVISLADTDVRGELCFAGAHFVAFEPGVIPYEKVITWFKAPEKDDEIYVSGDGETSFNLDNLRGMGIDSAAVERGVDYYDDNRVRYLCVDGTRGRAIVEGTKPYELEFCYAGGEIRGLTCSCYCNGACKHGFAAMLQLKETLEVIEKSYAARYEKSGYFAAVSKGTLRSFVLDGKESGSIFL